MDYCAECTYLCPDKSKGDSKGLFYCEKRDNYILAVNEHCYSFCHAYSRPSWEIDDLKNRSDREKNGYDKPNCYITTIVCDVLGFDDNCPELTLMRHLRDDLLTKDEKYKQLLVEYDELGPLIAKAISNSKEKFLTAKLLHENVIRPICKLIINKQYDSAINMYWGMTKGLLVGFGYGDVIVSEDEIKNCDIATSGHGKRKMLINNVAN